MSATVSSRFEKSTHITTLYKHSEKVAEVRKGRLSRPGRSIDQKLRVVCSPCNNGWMSVLQNNAKPMLLPVLDGSASASSLFEHRATIARWCAMSSVVFETADELTATSTEEQRRWIKDELSAHHSWRVWVSTLRMGAPEPSHCRSAFAILRGDNSAAPYAHVDFVVAGHLAYVTASVQSAELGFLPRVASALTDMVHLTGSGPEAATTEVSFKDENDFFEIYHKVRSRFDLNSIQTRWLAV